MIAILAPTPAVGQCTLTCPNVTQSSDPNQCGAVVNYSAPGTSGTCGAVTASPPSGSFYPVGTTLITATSQFGGGKCGFTVRVNDTQPPTITCPANISGVVATATTRLGFTAFPTSSDNCPGVSALINQPGAPLGTNAIPATATDRAGNTATCSFQATVRLAFDFNGDGRADIVTAAGPGGGPQVRVFSGANGQDLLSFFAYDVGFTGGVRAAVCDLNLDGVPDIVTAPGPGGGPHIRAFNGATGAQLPTAIGSFLAYAPGFTGGVFVGCDDVNGDGVPDVLTGAGAGGGPHVRAFNGATGAELIGVFAFTPAFTGGVFVAP
jgi:hypothetical protein